MMTPQLRNFYKLEKRWKDADVFDCEAYLSSTRQEKQLPVVSNLESSADEADSEEDPFWK